MLNDKTALVVEADAHSLVAIGAILKDLGIAYKRNTTGFAVPQNVQAMNPKPDFILLDMDLPRGDPFDIIAALKDDASTADIPVIAIADDPFARTLKATPEAGFAGLLAKPLPRRHFGAMLERILSGKPIWQMPA